MEKKKLIFVAVHVLIIIVENNFSKYKNVVFQLFRNNFFSYKWRKFVMALHTSLHGSEDASGCREAMREAEEAYRCSVRQLAESAPGVTQFTNLVIAWAAKHLRVATEHSGLGPALAEVFRGVEIVLGR